MAMVGKETAHSNDLLPILIICEEKNIYIWEKKLVKSYMYQTAFIYM